MIAGLERVAQRCGVTVQSTRTVDRGVGIAADRVAEIFEPFYTTKSGGTGMGMGLAIARSIIEAHGGRMAADNNPTGGAIVSFSLPVAPGAQG